MIMFTELQTGPSRGWGNGVSYPGPHNVWETPPSAKNIKYARIYQKKFF